MKARFKITASDPLLSRYSASHRLLQIPSHCRRCSRSWISTKLSKAVTIGVSVAIMVKLVTVEYCRPVNWVTLLIQTPRMPMVNNAGQVLRGGSSFSPRQASIANSVRATIV
ncbi:MAG: hypothetical protein LUC29_02930 [Acidaminococcaceae bacterium]|nr:hypothetical protein [Acidaminococcaceae bacterium]